MNKREFGDAGWSMRIPHIAIWRRRVLCDALLGVVALPQNATKVNKMQATWRPILLIQSTDLECPNEATPKVLPINLHLPHSCSAVSQT